MPPTYESNLVLVTHFFRHTSLSREAVITFALVDMSGQTAQQLADSIHTLAGDSFDQLLDSNVEINRTTTLKGTGGTAFTVGTSTGPPKQGTKTMSSLPSNTAGLIQKRSALGGRKGRGRVYLPWVLNETGVSEIGVLLTPDLNELQAAATQYFTGYAGTMVIANRLYDLPWDNPNRQLLAVVSGPVVTALVASPIAATQRRRMPRF